MSLSVDFLQKVKVLYQQFSQFDATQADRLKRYRNIEPESAQYLAMLIRIQQSQKILEIGTSTGYSTLWLADAASVTGGQVVTLEIEAERTAQAQAYAADFQLSDQIDFRICDAFDFLQQNQTQYDFILLDAERHAYVSYWPYLQGMFKQQGGVLIVDNVISHAAEVKEFITQVKQDTRYISMTLPIGAGLFVVTMRDVDLQEKIQ